MYNGHSKETGCGSSNNLHNAVNKCDRYLPLLDSLLVTSKRFWIKLILSGVVVLLVMAGYKNSFTVAKLSPLLMLDKHISSGVAGYLNSRKVN
jgi:hypothetical protein